MIASPQLFCRLDLQLEPASILPNYHAEFVFRCIQGNVSGTHVGKDALAITSKRFSETATAAYFDEKTIADVKRHMANRFTGWQSLHRTILAQDAEAIGHRVFAAMQSPRWAKSPLHRRLNAAGRKQAYFLRHAKTPAELTRSARVLAQSAIGDKDRSLALARFNRGIVRVAVVDAKSRVLSVAIV